MAACPRLSANDKGDEIKPWDVEVYVSEAVPSAPALGAMS